MWYQFCRGGIRTGYQQHFIVQFNVSDNQYSFATYNEQDGSQYDGFIGKQNTISFIVKMNDTYVSIQTNLLLDTTANHITYDFLSRPDIRELIGKRNYRLFKKHRSGLENFLKDALAKSNSIRNSE